MHHDIDRVLIPSDDIRQRVHALAETITADHADFGEVTMVPILTGAMIFCADLMRQMPLKMRIGLMTVSSYPGKSIRSQGAAVLSEQIGNVKGRHVLLVDDILDSGNTLRIVKPMLLDLGAASVRLCVLLSKNRPEAADVKVDYVGFDIPDEFVVGYGLDYDDIYRNLPDICTLKPSVYGGA